MKTERGINRIDNRFIQVSVGIDDHANRVARQLAENLQREANVEIVLPVEANAVFARMDDKLAQGLRARGWHFYKFIEPDVYRLMCSWATTESDIGDFIRDVTLNH